MLDTLVAIALAGCWIVGFFVSAQFLYHQSQIARKLDEWRKQENIKAQNSKSK